MEMVKRTIQGHPLLSIVLVISMYICHSIFFDHSFSGCNYSIKTSMQVMFVGEILFCSLRKFMQSTQTSFSSTTSLVLDILDLHS